MDLEVQHWIAEALEGAARVSELMGNRFALAGVRHWSQGKEESRKEAGSQSLAARKAPQAVIRAATTDPLSDSQLERVVMLALGKRVPDMSETSKAVTAHTAAAAAGGRDSSRAAAAEFISGHQVERRMESKDEGEDRASDSIRAGESPPAVSRIQPAPPEPQEAAAQAPSEVSDAQSEGASQPAEAAVTTQGRKRKNRAAKRAARVAREAGDGPPTAGPGGGEGSQASPVAEPLGKKRMQCPVFGCTRRPAPNDCPTFLDMTPKGVVGHGPHEAAVLALLATPD